MSEKEEIWERKNFWKWLCLSFIISTILFGLGFCEPLYHAKHKVPHFFNKSKQEGTGYYEKIGHENDGQSKDLIGVPDKKKVISAYRIVLPSNKFKVYAPVTKQQLCNRWHVTIPEFEMSNPDLSDVPNNQPLPKDDVVTVPKDNNSQGFEQDVFVLVNKERAKQGLKSLKNDDANLNRSALAKSQDMNNSNYFDHNSPKYGSPFDMMHNFGITYNYAAENIAKGQKTPQEVMTAWLNSSGHRANILNPNLTHIGVGYYTGKNGTFWTQQFIGK